MELRGKVLVVGATGTVGLPVTLALADDPDIEVWAVARFQDEHRQAQLQSKGVTCHTMDMASDELEGLPDDFDYVLNFGVVRSRNYRWSYDLDANAGGLGVIASHCRRAKALLHCSSTNVYRPNGQHPLREDDPLSDTPRASDVSATYTICRIAAEAMARFCARHFGIPTTIARLNVPYGRNGGWMGQHLAMILADKVIPVFPGPGSTFNPIHESDILAMIPRLLAVADRPAVTVNWGGSEPVTVEQWCSYIGHLVGKPARFVTTDLVVGPTPIDLSRMHALVGPTSMPWRTGVRDMVSWRVPDVSLADDPTSDPPSVKGALPRDPTEIR